MARTMAAPLLMHLPETRLARNLAALGDRCTALGAAAAPDTPLHPPLHPIFYDLNVIHGAGLHDHIRERVFSRAFSVELELPLQVNELRPVLLARIVELPQLDALVHDFVELLTIIPCAQSHLRACYSAAILLLFCCYSTGRLLLLLLPKFPNSQFPIPSPNPNLGIQA